MAKKIKDAGEDFLDLGGAEVVQVKTPKQAVEGKFAKGKHKALTDFSASLIFLYNVNYLTEQLEGKRLKDLRIMGADLSINAPGIIILDSKGNIVHEQTILSKPNDKRGTVAKIETIYLEFNKIFAVHSPDVIVQEDINAGGSHQAVKKISYVASLLRLCIAGNYKMESQPPIFLYPSTSLKLCFTGSGRAEKQQVLEAHKLNSGIDFGKDDNKADAYSCARVGKAVLDILVKFKEYREELEDSNIFIHKNSSIDKFNKKTSDTILSFIDNSSGCCITKEEFDLAIFNLIDADLLSEVNGYAYQDLKSKVKKIKPV